MSVYPKLLDLLKRIGPAAAGVGTVGAVAALAPNEAEAWPWRRIASTAENFQDVIRKLIMSDKHPIMSLTEPAATLDLARDFVKKYGGAVDIGLSPEASHFGPVPRAELPRGVYFRKGAVSATYPPARFIESTPKFSALAHEVGHNTAAGDTYSQFEPVIARYLTAHFGDEPGSIQRRLGSALAKDYDTTPLTPEMARLRDELIAEARGFDEAVNRLGYEKAKAGWPPTSIIGYIREANGSTSQKVLNQMVDLHYTKNAMEAIQRRVPQDPYAAIINAAELNEVQRLHNASRKRFKLPPVVTKLGVAGAAGIAGEEASAQDPTPETPGTFIPNGIPSVDLNAARANAAAFAQEPGEKPGVFIPNEKPGVFVPDTPEKVGVFVPNMQNPPSVDLRAARQNAETFAGPTPPTTPTLTPPTTRPTEPGTFTPEEPTKPVETGSQEWRRIAGDKAKVALKAIGDLLFRNESLSPAEKAQLVPQVLGVLEPVDVPLANVARDLLARHAGPYLPDQNTVKPTQTPGDILRLEEANRPSTGMPALDVAADFGTGMLPYTAGNAAFIALGKAAKAAKTASKAKRLEDTAKTLRLRRLLPSATLPDHVGMEAFMLPETTPGIVQLSPESQTLNKVAQDTLKSVQGEADANIASNLEAVVGTPKLSTIEKLKAAVRNAARTVPDAGPTGTGGAAKNMLVSGEKTLRRQGKAGEELADRLLQKRTLEGNITGTLITGHVKDTKGLMEPEYNNFVDVLKGTAQPMNPAVAAASVAEKTRLDALFDKAASLKLGQCITLPSGMDATIYFVKHPSYDLIEAQGQIVDLRSVAEAMVAEAWGVERKSLTIPDAEALFKLDNAPAKGVKELDARKLLPTFYHTVAQEVASAQTIGPSVLGSKRLTGTLETLLKRIEREGGDAETARDIVKTFLGGSPFTDTQKAMWDRLSGAEALTKLGRAVISNLSQPVLTAPIVGNIRFFRGALTAIFHPRTSRELAEMSGAIGETVAAEAKRSAGLVGKTFLGKMGRGILNVTGFSSVEDHNRIFGAVEGRLFARDLAKKLASNPGDTTAARQLKLWTGLNPVKIAQQGGLTKGDELYAAKYFADRTQFKSDVLALPPGWLQSPTARALTLYKQFSFQQTRLIKDAGIDALRAVKETKDIRPLTKFLIPFATTIPAAGYLTRAAKNFVLGKEPFPDEDVVQAYMGSIASIGALGVMFDAMQSTQFRQGVNFATGPVFSDIGGVLNAGGQAWDTKSPAPLGQTALKNVPIFGPRLVRMAREAAATTGKAAKTPKTPKQK
jgi:hypothetical protein